MILRTTLVFEVFNTVRSQKAEAIWKTEKNNIKDREKPKYPMLSQRSFYTCFCYNFDRTTTE